MLRLPLFPSLSWIGGALAGAILMAAPAYLKGRGDGVDAQRELETRAELALLRRQRAAERFEVSALITRIEEELALRRSFDAAAVQAFEDAAQSTQLALKRLGETYDPTHACPASDDDVRVFNAAFAVPGPGVEPGRAVAAVEHKDPQ
ncbi:hypothetical protein [Maricaulis sp.]|uniref:hypothetical protein n=1 Tax=Maricaulis sp. TaxID=1486257 RepID=UPI00261F64B1|nr:hypothetical protein [Maricaulis sp.]